MSAAAQAAWAVASALAFAAMSAAIKLGYARYGLFELVFWRNALGAVAVVDDSALVARIVVALVDGARRGSGTMAAGVVIVGVVSPTIRAPSWHA